MAVKCVIPELSPSSLHFRSPGDNSRLFFFPYWCSCYVMFYLSRTTQPEPLKYSNKHAIMTTEDLLCGSRFRTLIVAKNERERPWVNVIQRFANKKV